MLMMGMMALGASPVPIRPPEDDWSVLIQKAGQGDQHAFGILYDQSSRMVYGVALRILANPADAEEVTLDVYTQVWRSATQYSRDRGTPLAWLLTIARSRALDRFRLRENRQSKETDIQEVAEVQALTESAEETAWLSQVRTKVRSAMRELTSEQRQAIEMAYFGGFSHSELAERLGEPLGTVKTRIRLAMQRLRQLLGEGGLQ